MATTNLSPATAVNAWMSPMAHLQFSPDCNSTLAMEADPNPSPCGKSRLLRSIGLHVEWTGPPGRFVVVRQRVLLPSPPKILPNPVRPPDRPVRQRSNQVSM